MAPGDTARPRAVRDGLAGRSTTFRAHGDARLHARCPRAAARGAGLGGRSGRRREQPPLTHRRPAGSGRPGERTRLASGVRHDDGRSCTRRVDGGLAVAPGRRRSRDRRTDRESRARCRVCRRRLAVGRAVPRRAAPPSRPRTDRVLRSFRATPDTAPGTPAGAQRTTGTHRCPCSSLPRAEASACPVPPARSFPCPRTTPPVRHTAAP